MSTQHVTIGGKEVDLTPGGPVRRKSPAATAITLEQERQAANRTGLTATIVGLLAALGLLIIVIVWLSRQRRQP